MLNERKKFADPGLLGLSAFVISQSLLNIPNTHLVNPYATPLFLTTVLFCGGGIQFLCSIFEYIRGNMVGMTTFGLFGGFFTSLGMFILFELNGTLKFGTAGEEALGTFLLLWSILAIPFAIAAYREERLLGWMFIFVLLAFFGGSFTALLGLNSAFGGWAGLISAVIGFYIVFKGLLAATTPEALGASKSE
ncbi:MAG TPA: acetate uptake transporter [Candidatus Angelobacter sp.]|nr:acetate uptake transporter [Candidatus Angelobacter sp.]